MSIRDVFKRWIGAETRAGAALTSWDLLAGAAPAFSGYVDERAILSNSAVAARCVALRSELLASVPLHLYRRTADGGRERADDVPLYGVLHDMANPNVTAFEARELMVRSLDTAGNAYARIERDGRGAVVALWPYAPRAVAVEKLESGRLRYRVSDGRGRAITLLQDEMLHVRGPSRDGDLGQSPIAIARAAAAMAVGHSDVTAALLKHHFRRPGIVSFASALSIEGRAQAIHTISSDIKRHNIAVADNGADFKPVGLSPEDAEFLQSRRLANEDVARIFGLPPTTVGITDKATYSNTEQESRALVQNALGPLAARIETAMGRCLLSAEARRNLYIEHDLAGLLRGDMAARYGGYAVGRQWGWLSPNDVRRLENMAPIAAGDEYVRPLNMGPLGSVPVPARERTSQ